MKKPGTPKTYATKKEAEAALKDARRYLAQASKAENRPMIQLWYATCESIREQIAKF